MLSSCGSKPQEAIAEYKGDIFKIEARTQEYHNSGIKNVELCAMPISFVDFPKDEGQCILKGYDFSDLFVKWKAPQEVEISFKCGRVSSFKNFALVPGRGGQPVQVHATLIDKCGRADSA